MTLIYNFKLRKIVGSYGINITPEHEDLIKIITVHTYVTFSNNRLYVYNYRKDNFTVVDFEIMQSYKINLYSIGVKYGGNFYVTKDGNYILFCSINANTHKIVSNIFKIVKAEDGKVYFEKHLITESYDYVLSLDETAVNFINYIKNHYRLPVVHCRSKYNHIWLRNKYNGSYKQVIDVGQDYSIRNYEPVCIRGVLQLSDNIYYNGYSVYVNEPFYEHSISILNVDRENNTIQFRRYYYRKHVKIPNYIAYVMPLDEFITAIMENKPAIVNGSMMRMFINNKYIVFYYTVGNFRGKFNYLDADGKFISDRCKVYNINGYHNY